MKKLRLPVLAICCVLLFVGSTVIAQEASKAEADAKAMADQKAMMDAWMKAATPGEPHKKLEAMAGSWSVKSTMWAAPGAPPEEGTGTSENAMILGGRWLQQKFQGTAMGMPFEGVGYTGYDNIRKTFVGTWMDSMSTGVMASTGSDGEKGVMTFTGTMDDPMSGKSFPVKETVRIIDADHHTFEMWGPAPDGTMFKNMELVYTRKK